ncbi:MAG: HAD-IC family P-type ATPase [Myxococcales bacterium]|nr:HAD-IC family P-type ATPase [Myxococcales bacterium]
MGRAPAATAAVTNSTAKRSDEDTSATAAPGLTTAEAERLLAKHGPNALPETPPTPLWRRFVRQLRSPLIYILLFAIAFDVGVWIYEHWKGWPVEGFVIAVVVLLNAGLGSFQEYRSDKALGQLKALTASEVWAMRDGKLLQIPSVSLVPGDVVRIEAGDRIPADGTFLSGEGVMTDEAVLTGESVPVEKAVEAPLHSGTLVVRGKGEFRVSETGPRSAMGKIATMLGEIKPEPTPLERRLGSLGKQLAFWVSGLAVLLVVAGTLTEGIGRLDEVVMFAVALAIAAIPEGMPAVVTLTLALGVQRMARRNALVRRLSAVEALGSVTVIATDKTGTLTEESMVVRELASDDPEGALRAMVLANDADTEAAAGDPLELGLLSYARAQGKDPAAERSAHARVESRPFDSAWKYMRVTVEGTGGRTSYLKGAPEVLLDLCEMSAEARAQWAERSESAAGRGYKVLALARSSAEAEPEERLQFLGLVMLWDPPRAEIAEAIQTAQRAGVRVLMITGDHPGTARAVAEVIGIPSPTVLSGADIDTYSVEQLRQAARTANVFARVSPAHKLKLVEALQADGEIVAMTGDGVNDAPALKRADVGIAMGKRGSDVTREVADLVLLDDNFATIVGAIEEGRGIYENIQTFIRFTFSTNVALMVLVVTGAVVAHVKGYRDTTGMLLLPLTALQLLWINFLGDGPPALALALDRTPGQMALPPRPPSSGLLDRASGRFILVTGAFKGALGIALLLMLPAFGFGLIVTQTVVFLYESVGKLVSVYPARLVVADRPKNWVLHVSIVAGIALQGAAVTIPGLRRFLGLEALDGKTLAIVVLAVIATWAVAALTRWTSAPRTGAQVRSEHPPRDEDAGPVTAAVHGRP